MRVVAAQDRVQLAELLLQFDPGEAQAGQHADLRNAHRRSHARHFKSRANSSATFNSVITEGESRTSLRSRRTVGIEASPCTFAKDN